MSDITGNALTVEFCYSWNGEDFRSGTFGSLGAALCSAAADNDGEHTHVYIGKAQRPINSQFFPNAEDVIEHIENQAYDYGGEFAEDYMDVSSEANEDLNNQLHALLDSWCKKHGLHPDFYQVYSVKEYLLPPIVK